MRCKAGLASLVFLALVGCTTYTDVKEIKHIGFSDDLSKGKPIGLITSDDCVYHVMGYALGGRPTINKAISNARTQKKSNLLDTVHDQGSDLPPIRYATNVTTKRGGFDALVLRKDCIEINGRGFE